MTRLLEARRPMVRGFAGTIAIALMVASVLMSGSPALAAKARIVRIEIAPASTTLVLGAAQQFSATGVLSDGSMQDVTAQARWTSSDAGIVRFSKSPRGFATALALGNASVFAAVGQVSGAAAVQVTALQSIEVTPVATLPPGAPPVDGFMPRGVSLQFLAVGHYADGSTHSLTQSATWSSSDPAVATVSNDSGSAGVVETGCDAGSTSIQASFGGVTGAFELGVFFFVVVGVEITPADPVAAVGDEVQFQALIHLSCGGTQTALPGTIGIWTSDDESIAYIDSQGLAVAVAPGTVSITAVVNPEMTFLEQEISASTTLEVGPPALRSVEVTPPDATINDQQAQQFLATGRYSDGSIRDVSSLAEWDSSDVSIATVDASGLATAHGPGVVSITASLDGVSGIATLTIGGHLTSIEIAPTDPTVTIGGSVLLTATGTFSDGSMQDVTEFATWQSSDSAVARSVGGGFVTGDRAGTATISAALNDVSGSTTVHVVEPELLAIDISAQGSGELFPGEDLQLDAVGTYSNGDLAGINDLVDWASSDPSIARVEASGLVIAVAEGDATITASVGPIAGSITITVHAPSSALQSIEVTPVATLPPGAPPVDGFMPRGVSLQFLAVGHYADGSTHSLTQSATWSSSDPAVATVSNDSGSAGVVETGCDAGSTSIQASFGGVTGAFELGVFFFVVVGVEITPADPVAAVGDEVQFQALIHLSCGGTQTALPGTIGIWTSDDESIAYIDSQGLAVAVAPGTVSITAVVNPEMTFLEQEISASTTLEVGPPAGLRAGTRRTMDGRGRSSSGRDSTS